MPGPSTRDLKPAKRVLAPSLHPDEEEKRREAELRSVREETRDPADHVESAEEQQARESEAAFEHAITRLPPG